MRWHIFVISGIYRAAEQLNIATYIPRSPYHCLSIVMFVFYNLLSNHLPILRKLFRAVQHSS